jgi:hypothetical protein
MFDAVMQPGRLASELLRIADEASTARERLRELIRLAQELRARLDKPTEGSPGEGAPRKLEAVK